MYAAENRRSFVRACAAKALATRRKATPLSFVQSFWPEDEDAQLIVRAISHPLETTNFPQIQTTRILPMLAPNAASSKVLNIGAILDLANVGSVKLPHIGGSGRPAQPIFVGENQPIPVVDLTTNAATLGPACKMALSAVVTNEIQQASADTAEKIVSDALAIACETGTDAALFSSTGATSTQPPGLLHGVTTIPSTGETGPTGVADDLGLIADAIGSAGIGTDDLVFVATPSLAIKIQVHAGPRFQDRVFSSASLAAGMVIGIEPRALAVGYTGVVEVEASTGGTVHMDDVTPLPIVDDSGARCQAIHQRIPTKPHLLESSRPIVRGGTAWCCCCGNRSRLVKAMTVERGVAEGSRRRRERK